MELIRPTMVASSILALIEDARQKLIIVSPYNNFNYWPKFIRHFHEAHQRGVNIEYFVREDENHSSLGLININPFFVPNLHAKLYINEKYAIFSSMNLIKYSDDFSIDFAMKTQSPEEYRQAIEFFELYVQPKAFRPNTFSAPVARQEAPIHNIPLAQYFKDDIYWQPDVTFHSIDHFGSDMIAEMGFRKNGEKIGDWLKFNSDGFLIRLEKFGNEPGSVDVNYDTETSLYFLLFSLANCIRGLYKADICDFYFKSNLNTYTKNNPRLLYKHIEKVLEINNLEADNTVSGLMRNINEKLRQKKGVQKT